MPVSTGKLLTGADGSMATWAEVKAKALKLGIQLTDVDVGNVPLLDGLTYGNFIPGANGFAQVVTGNGVDGIPNTADDISFSGTNGARRPDDRQRPPHGHAFLADIAHAAVPVGKIADGDIEIGLANRQRLRPNTTTNCSTRTSSPATAASTRTSA